MNAPSILLDPAAVCRRLGGVALALVAINMGLQVARLVLQQENLPGLPMLSLDKENNVPALFSTLLLFTAALILAFVALLERVRARQDAPKWFILAAGFLLMGVDESLSLHERMIEPMRALLGSSLGVERLGIFYFAWVVPAIALVIALGIYFLPFMGRLPRRTGMMLLVSAAIYLGGALGVELVEGWWREGHGHRNVVYHGLVSLEEGMEMIGIVLLIHTLLDFLSARHGEVRIALVGDARTVPEGPALTRENDIPQMLGRSAIE